MSKAAAHSAQAVGLVALTTPWSASRPFAPIARPSPVVGGRNNCQLFFIEPIDQRERESPKKDSPMNSVERRAELRPLTKQRHDSFHFGYELITQTPNTLVVVSGGRAKF